MDPLADGPRNGGALRKNVHETNKMAVITHTVADLLLRIDCVLLRERKPLLERNLVLQVKLVAEIGHRPAKRELRVFAIY